MKTSILGIFTAAAASLIWSSSIAQERSFLCKFTNGPRQGQIQDYTGHPAGPLPVGTPCNDGISSSGVIVSKGEANGSSGGRNRPNDGGSCRKPSKEEDCDKCISDRSYERCLNKLNENE